ncbi:putative tetratricopeptide repeat protein 41 isoform X2 [Tursiops truncatus]|uniref:putative tetratricopeptide repeat protein 41 isoform X2 n=1 Tax=Tursiops truncatus TaxID=9739 RepID=UPI003CCF4CF5
MFSKATDLSSLSIMEQNLYVAARNCYPWVLENPNRSLIELEIIQAAFLNESQFQYFYFRTGTMLLKPMDEEKEEMVSAGFLINNEEKLKIGKLKAKIISKGLPVRLYRDLHELDFKHNFERFYHEEFTEKCKEVFVISKESNRTFEILERFALKDVEFDFNNAAAGPSLSILRCNHSRQRERSICLSEPNESQESTSPPNLGQILPKANGFLESVSRAALAHEDERLLGGFVQPSLKS